jgi:hypothetical protein
MKNFPLFRESLVPWSWLPGAEHFLQQLGLPLTHAEVVHTARVNTTMVVAMSRKQ